jgi:hypothetical protein
MDVAQPVHRHHLHLVSCQGVLRGNHQFWRLAQSRGREAQPNRDSLPTGENLGQHLIRQPPDNLRRDRRAFVRAREPLAELSRRLVRGPSIERHQGGGHTGKAHNLRAPPILGDGRNFDQVHPSRDGFFKAMYGGSHSFGLNFENLGSATNCTHCAERIKRSGRRRRIHSRQGRRIARPATHNFFSLSIRQQDIHLSSTTFAQPPIARWRGGCP